jgi:hypothetical protein
MATEAPPFGDLFLGKRETGISMMKLAAKEVSQRRE